ncbi:MAG: 5'(3')-deoxyribonucleotidase [Tannerellaceae bacterium]|nr:5'(3')-deoxyribonucleotidase [Tannerellaceae bacterium]
MKQVLVDMDGVLADVYAQFIRLEKEKTGTILSPESLIGKKEAHAFPHYETHVTSSGFFRTAPIIPGSVKGLEYLNNKYDVLIVSSATEFPDSLKEKLDWLNEHYPFISWQQMIFCGKKDSIKGDIMIDDHPKNLDAFPGRRIIFTQPHNAQVENPSYERVSTWEEICTIL